MLRISNLYIYPIKSMGGIRLDTARVTDRGLEYDRRWMIIGQDNVQLTQRQLPVMALLKVAITSAGLQVTYLPPTPQYPQASTQPDTLHISFQPCTGEYTDVRVWDDTCRARYVSPEADAWFSNILETPCRLVYMPDETHRQTDLNYTKKGHITSFADGYPFLLIGQSSLDELNNRLDQTLPMNRFRPNIVFTGGTPFQEDQLRDFTIGNIRFSGVKLCARCVVTTINQQTAQQGKEPLRTLATFRAKDKKILFGQNLIHHGLGNLTVGDELIPVS